jgi:DNA repair photolyase
MNVKCNQNCKFPQRKEDQSQVKFIERKSLLYKSEVEYGDYTINATVGCTHGCNFPCYAMMMAKRFGWVKDYDDWRIPRLTSNAIEILDKEIPKFKNDIHFVHLSFMTDPFMYDSEKKDLVPEVKDLTLKIIQRLNREGIKVTTLTKGFYPEEIIEGGFLKDNEYGITLVSLNEDFKKEFEPYSAPYKKRIASLKMLHDNGLKTWVSIEPYPTPNLDKNAEHIEKILEKIEFTDKIIFGKLNYNTKSKKFTNNEEFYMRIAGKIINFCNKYNISYHVKTGTPMHSDKTEKILTT